MTLTLDDATVDPAPLGFEDSLLAGVRVLTAVPTAEKIAALDRGGRVLAAHAADLVASLTGRGYPPSSARAEVGVLPELLSARYLHAVVANPASVPGGPDALDGGFVPVDGGVRVSLSPAGPVLLVGSGNSFVPAIMATTTALLAGCPVALRGSRVNHALLERVFALLDGAGDPVLSTLVAQVHPFFLDHRDPVDARRLQHLAATGPFAVGNFWGGGDALDELCAALGRNPRHPVAVPMEPLSGVALLSGHEVATDRAGYASALATAMTTLGQQMCSSPTAAVFVGDTGAAGAFAADVAAALERIPHTGEVAVPPGVAMRLDRVRDRCAEEGATVLVPADEGPDWTVMVSDATSVVDALPAGLAPHIHDRRHFLEIVAVPDLDAAADRIAAQPAGPCHTGVVAVQTLLTFCSTAEAEHVATGLRRRGAPAFRIVPPARVMLRHALEPLDGRHLLAAFTRQTVLVEPADGDDHRRRPRPRAVELRLSAGG